MEALDMMLPPLGWAVIMGRMWCVALYTLVRLRVSCADQVEGVMLAGSPGTVIPVGEGGLGVRVREVGWGVVLGLILGLGREMGEVEYWSGLLTDVVD